MKQILLILALAFSSMAQAGEYIIKFKNTSPNALIQKAEGLGLNVTDVHQKASLVQVSIDDKDLVAQLKQIQRNENVEYIVENFKLHAIKSNYTLSQLRDQWAIAKVNAEKAWNLAGNKGVRDIVVAVIDTGVDYRHESLAPNMVAGYDFRDNDADPMDQTSAQNPGHGTHVAGIVGATGEVNGGIIGLGARVSIMPIRFLGADGSGDLMGGIKSIDFAIEKGAQVINASWGAKIAASQAQPLIEAVKRASDAGIIFVSAAGNDGASNDKTGFYPANAKFENTITVAASGSSDSKPSWSNYGRAIVDVAAPGEQIMSTLPGNKYQNLSGTSMASPLVAGLVGLLLSQNSEMTGAQVRSVMQLTGAKVGIETACNCRIDAGAAMETVKQNKLVVVPAAATVAPTGTLQFSGFQGTAPYTFASSNAAVAEIDANGLLTAKSKGETTVTVTDSAGQTSQSLAIRIADLSDGGGGGGTPPPGGGGECPFDPQTCEMLCGIMPDAPWCQK
jgi:thermitase